MNDQTDAQLLRAYTEQRSDPAFAELVRRHVDLVHSAALRMVCDSHLAQDVTQGVFLALARSAAQLMDRPVLSGWLHRTDVRRRVREQEVAAMNELLSAEPDALWEHIAPQLDTALGELSEADRDAVLLRYFERKSASEMATTLGISDEAAQKRVNRAVERLREFFAKRGLTVGASGLVVVISANAVQAAPAGLAVTISTAAALTGTTICTTVTATAIKTIAMTTLQKSVITAALAVAVGAGIYEARQASQLRDENQTLQQQQAPLASQVEQLQRSYNDATNRLASLRDDNERLNRNTAELLKLRGEVSRLRRELQESAQTKAAVAVQRSPPIWQPFDLSQFPDSRTEVRYSTASDVGTATPAALLQTWLWALRTGDEEGLNKVWDYPPETPAAKKQQAIEERKAYVIANQNRTEADSTGFENHRLIELLPLGPDKYLALIAERTSTVSLGTHVMRQVFRKVGTEWKVFVGPPTYSPTGD